QFGSMEGILANTDQLKGKQRENLETFAEQGLISKKLATIQLDVPVELDEEALVLGEPNKAVLEPLFAELEFRTLGRRVFGEEFNVSAGQPASGMQMDLFGNAAQPHADITNADNNYVPPAAGKNVNNTPHTYVLADTAASQQELAELLSKQRSFCFDTETTGTDANTADLVGLSFAIEPGKAWYVAAPSDPGAGISVLACFKPVFENASIEKVGQNIKYDILLLARYGVAVNGPLFDTMLAHYLIDPDTRHGMDMLAENYLGYTPIPITDLIGPRGK